MRPPGGIMMPGMPGMGSGFPGAGGSSPRGGRLLFGGPAEGGEPNTVGSPPGTATARIIDNARLVELSIYAIASIYERFPPRPKETTSPTSPVDPGKN